MSHYAYYQRHTPGWGTNNYEFAPPPAPTYTPQASWHGSDYYRAHGGYNTEPSFFDSVWSKVKSFVGNSPGFGRSEAKHWHKRVYGGIVSVNQLMPTELGAAAGYEAIRIWEQHKNIYREPLHDDRDMEREALAGIAVAEASKLWQLAGQGRPGGRETSEVAAATAERIFNHQYDQHHDRYRDREYDYEGGYYDSSSGHHHRRRRSSGTYYRPSAAQYGHPSSSAMAIPITSHGHRHHEYEYNPHGHPGSYDGYGQPGSYGQMGGYGGGGYAYPGSYPPQQPYGGHSPYGRSTILPQPAYSSASGGPLHSPYAGSTSLVPMTAGALVPVSRGRRNSFSGDYVPSTAYSYR